MFHRNQVLLAVGVLVLLIVVGAGAYIAGRNAGLTEQLNIRTEFFQQRAGNPSGAPSAPGTFGSDTTQAARTAQGRQLAAGVVKSVQGNVIQVTQRDGSTTSITLDDKTTSVTKTIAGTLADIQPGWTIIVSEQTGTGGTIHRVLLTQELGQGQGQRGGQGQGQPTPKP